jgi:hypothetical protein
MLSKPGTPWFYRRTNLRKIHYTAEELSEDKNTLVLLSFFPVELVLPALFFLSRPASMVSILYRNS